LLLKVALPLNAIEAATNWPQPVDPLTVIVGFP
jgi:hypothetical protein